MSDSPNPAPEVFVGVDIAKGKHYACAVSASGEALFARVVPNDKGGHSQNDQRRRGQRPAGVGG